MSSERRRRHAARGLQEAGIHPDQATEYEWHVAEAAARMTENAHLMADYIKHRLNAVKNEKKPQT